VDLLNSTHGPNATGSVRLDDKDHIAFLKISTRCEPLAALNQRRDVFVHPTAPKLVNKSLRLSPLSLREFVAGALRGRRQMRLRAAEKKMIGREGFQILRVNADMSERAAVQKGSDFSENSVEDLVSNGLTSEHSFQCVFAGRDQLFLSSTKVRTGRRRKVEGGTSVGHIVVKSVLVPLFQRLS